MASPPVLSVSSSGGSVPTSVDIKRYESLRLKFAAKFGTEAMCVARAPGRVNLIGEHIDYSGYAVLPMAISQDVLIAIAPRQDSSIVLSNILPEYEDRTYGGLDIDNTVYDWGNYILCGIKGVLEQAQSAQARGLSLLIDGVVPRGSGLSSSSAMVCCAALATAHACGITMSKSAFAELCVKSERYVGLESGGMDQSISFLAEEGSAKLIEFNPIRATPVALPRGGVFVIANSLVTSNKYVSAGSCYNKRVVECRLAAQVIGTKLSVPNLKVIRTLGQLQAQLQVPLKGMASLVEEHLHPAPYSKEELAQVLGLSMADLDTSLLSPTTVEQESFNLYSRARHVYAEAALVDAFQVAHTLEDLGALMNASHTSCAADFECSCPELDELTTLARASGAYGARLTGAGWGGCTVSLIAEDRVEAYLTALRVGYYASRVQSPEEKEVPESSYLFATTPGAGALVLVP